MDSSTSRDDMEIARLRTELSRERRARAHRTSLQEMSTRSSGAITRHDVAAVTIEYVTELLGAGWSTIAYVSDDEIVTFVHGPRTPPAIIDDWHELPLQTELPMMAVLRGVESRIEIADGSTLASSWPLVSQRAETDQIGSLIAVAVGSELEQPAAVLVVTWPNARTMDATDWDLVDEVIEAAAPALERSAETESDREISATLQEWLLPEPVSTTGDLEIATLYRPGRDEMVVGGDWYDVVPIATGTALVVGDVVGHDPRAAAEMGQVRHVLASHLIASGQLIESVAVTDRYFADRQPDTMATALIAVVHESGDGMEIVSAGHPAPLMIEPSGAVTVLECEPGPPIGSGLGGYSSFTASLAPGAALVVFTDGIVEARSSSIDAGTWAIASEIERAVRSVEGARNIAMAVRNALSERADEPWRQDDVAALVAARHVDPTDSADPTAPTPSRLRIDVEAATSEIATIREDVVEFARRTGAPTDTVDRLELAVSELATNVVCHAPADRISVDVAHRSDGWELVVDGAEHLTGADDVRLPPPDASSGRGLFVVQSVMDSVELTTIDGRRVVRCTITA